jgi:DNA-binding transcriptional MocR family regulator
MRRVAVPEPAVIDARLLTNLTGDWMTRPGPLYARLSAALLEVIRAGELRPGTRLPAERDLAEAFTVGRTTVVAALDLLRNDGWVESRQGSGSFVRTHVKMPLVADLDLAGTAASARQLVRNLIYPSHGLIDLGVASPYGLTPLLGELLQTPVGAVDALAGNGLEPLGTVALRHAVAMHLSTHGLPSDIPQVIITSGAQQALAISASLLVQRGDNVLLQSPSFPGAIDAFARAGGQLHPMDFGYPEWDIAAVRRVVEKTRPRAIYLMPGGHNPLGEVMPATTRREFAAIAAEFRLFVIEDNSLEELAYDMSLRTAPIGAYDTSGFVITIGSLSKSAWGGLRVGWLRANEPVTARVARVKAAADLGLPVLAQASGREVLARLDDISAERRVEFAAALDGVETALRGQLPDFDFDRPLSGMSLWIGIPAGNADGYAQLAMRHGVTITPGSIYCIDDAHPARFRLSVAVGTTVGVAAVARLAAAWTEYRTLV